MHSNEEMIHSDTELNLWPCQVLLHSVVSVCIRGMYPNHFHPLPRPLDSTFPFPRALAATQPGLVQPTGPPFHSSEKQTCRVAS